MKPSHLTGDVRQLNGGTDSGCAETTERPEPARRTDQAEQARPGIGPRRAPECPPAAAVLFGSALPAARRYADLLAGAAVDRGLLGPREVPRLWERHLLNCAVLAPLVPAGSRLVDVGSGAGLPGLLLALVRPDLEVLLVDALGRRCRFLDEAVHELGLANVTVRQGRAEQMGGLGADVVTARAVARVGRLATWCLPLLRPGGQLLAVRGAHADEEVAAAVVDLLRLGAEAWEVLVVGAEYVQPPTTVLRVTAGRAETPAAHADPPGTRSSQGTRTARAPSSTRHRNRAAPYEPGG